MAQCAGSAAGPVDQAKALARLDQADEQPAHAARAGGREAFDSWEALVWLRVATESAAHHAAHSWAFVPVE